MADGPNTERAREHLRRLCVDIATRPTGSAGNRAAAAYLADAGGEWLASSAGREVRRESHARRVPSWGCNVVATRGAGRPRRVIVCAHVDAELGTPGALDDAAGVVTLLLHVELLAEHGCDGAEIAIEFLAMNEEDHYANPGERARFAANEGRLGGVVLAVNLVDARKLVRLARALHRLIGRLGVGA